MFAFKTLERRLIVLLVVPVTLFLLDLGVAGYRFTSDLLFKEWQDTAVLRLERAAHQMDMRLDGQIQWMEELPGPGRPSRQGNPVLALAPGKRPRPASSRSTWPGRKRPSPKAQRSYRSGPQKSLPRVLLPAGR